MTRAQMKRAAMALVDDFGFPPGMYERASKAWRVPAEELNHKSPRYDWWINEGREYHTRDDSMEASMLMSEACRPDFEVRR